MRRAVSLVPSATAAVVAMGAGACLVGVSADCEQPRHGERLPVVTRPHIDPAKAVADPFGVDSAVRATIEAGASLYDLDVDAIVALAPHVLFAQDSCSVCAVPSTEVVAALTERGMETEVVSVDPHDLDTVLASFSVIGEALGDELAKAGQDLEERCRQRLGRLACSPDGAAQAVRPGLLVLDWVDPPFVAGNWVPELVAAAGGEALAAEAGMPSHQLSDAELEPNLSVSSSFGGTTGSPPLALVVVAPCGVDLDGAESMARASGWLARLVRRTEARVVAFDGRKWFSRPGPELVEGAEALAIWLSGAGDLDGVATRQITGIG